jgi:chromosome segregation ATPase
VTIPVWDELLTKANAAWLVLSGIGVAAVNHIIKLRRQLSELSTKLAKDRANEKVLAVETTLQTGWLQGILTDRENLQAEVRKLEDRIESFRESELNSARIIERRDAELVACREKITEAKTERDLALEEMLKTKEMLAAVREHVIVVDGQMLNLRVANARLFAALPDEARQQMIDLLLKPEEAAKK